MPALLPAKRSAQITFSVLLVASMILLGALILPIWKPLFMAVVLAAALTPVNDWIARKVGGRRRLATAITVVLVIIILLIPLTMLVMMIIGEAPDAYRFLHDTLQTGGVSALVERLPGSIGTRIRDAVDLASIEQTLAEQAMTGGQAAAGLLASLLSGVSGLLFDLGIMLIAFHALLQHGRPLLAWIHRISPLPETHELLVEARRVSGMVIRSSFATALLQGIVATIGFFIASVPNALFFGMITFFAAFIPSVGTAIITFPLVGLLVLSGYTWQPIFLAVWAIVAIGLIDNVVNPLLIRDGVHLNGVAIFLALVGGLFVFGGVGLIIGPLGLSFFLAMIRFAYRNYMEHAEPLAGPVPKTGVG